MKMRTTSTPLPYELLVIGSRGGGIHRSIPEIPIPRSSLRRHARQHWHLPPLVTFGLLLGGDRPALAMGVLSLFLVNLICVNPARDFLGTGN